MNKKVIKGIIVTGLVFTAILGAAVALANLENYADEDFEDDFEEPKSILKVK